MENIAITHEIEKGLKLAKSRWIEFKDVPPKPMKRKHYVRYDTVWR